jgi:hypothetical protein
MIEEAAMRRVILVMGGVVAVVALVWLGVRSNPGGAPTPASPAPAGPIGAPASQMPRGTPEQTGPPPSASAVELPETVRQVLDNPTWRPELKDEFLPAPLPAAAEALLVERYRAISSLSNKWGIIVILARSGSEAVVPLLTYAITNEFAGQTLSAWEAERFPRQLDLLGRQAQRHRSAYEFLEAACEPSFWEEHPLPQVPDLVTLKDTLVQCALLGLAISERPDALAFFEGIRARPPPGWQGNPGSVVDAVFWYHFVRKHGLEKIAREFTGYSIMRAFSDWYHTPEAAAWVEWADSVDGLRPFQRR